MTRTRFRGRLTTAPANMTIRHKPIKKTLHGLPRFTTVKGGAYVLLPGLRALRSLGNA